MSDTSSAGFRCRARAQIAAPLVLGAALIAMAGLKILDAASGLGARATSKPYVFLAAAELALAWILVRRSTRPIGVRLVIAAFAGSATAYGLHWVVFGAPAVCRCLGSIDPTPVGLITVQGAILILAGICITIEA